MEGGGAEATVEGGFSAAMTNPTPAPMPRSASEATVTAAVFFHRGQPEPAVGELGGWDSSASCVSAMAQPWPAEVVVR